MSRALRILALEPYFGGSHKAFIDGWRGYSRHEWTMYDLPARKWKWRMRHAALTFADRVRQELAAGAEWDVLLCSDMLNLGEFVGLVDERVRRLPRVVYFHENQLTYPFRYATERDYHFGFTNMTSALAADAVWFNSAFHRDSFLDELGRVLRRMPDYRSLDAVERIRGSSVIQPPGVEMPAVRGCERTPGPLWIVWAARWEHDKDPESFFAALEALKARGVAFRLNVVGEQFDETPAVFEEARKRFGDEIVRWGFQPTRAAYEAALAEADVFVSTAQHEFFGISLVEALAAGCYPLVPRRLAYPEVLGLDVDARAAQFFYDGTVSGLVERLADLASRVESGGVWQGDRGWGRARAAQFAWPVRGAAMDEALSTLVDAAPP